MRHRVCACVTVLVPFALAAVAAGQASTPADEAATRRWTAPKTIDGQPDLQGVWLIHTATPLERPKALEGKARLTDEEVTEFRRRADRLFKTGNGDFAVGDGVFQAVLGNADRYANPNASHGANEMIDLEFDNRTSLIADPQDGRIPPLTREGRQRITTRSFRRPMRQRRETLYEYACHEGNYHLMKGMLDDARLQAAGAARGNR